MSFEKHTLGAIEKLTAKTMRLEARCDALEIALGVVAQKAGIPFAKIQKSVDDLTALSYHKRLERVEGVDPAIAAEIDDRPIVPDLPSELPVGRKNEDGHRSV